MDGWLDGWMDRYMMDRKTKRERKKTKEKEENWRKYFLYYISKMWTSTKKGHENISEWEPRMQITCVSSSHSRRILEAPWFSGPQLPSVLDPVMGTCHSSFTSINREIKTT